MIGYAFTEDKKMIFFAADAVITAYCRIARGDYDCFPGTITIDFIAESCDKFDCRHGVNDADFLAENLRIRETTFKAFTKAFLAIRRHNRRHPADKIRWTEENMNKTLDYARILSMDPSMEDVIPEDLSMNSTFIERNYVFLRDFENNERGLKELNEFLGFGEWDGCYLLDLACEDNWDEWEFDDIPGDWIFVGYSQEKINYFLRDTREKARVVKFGDLLLLYCPLKAVHQYI